MLGKVEPAKSRHKAIFYAFVTLHLILRAKSLTTQIWRLQGDTRRATTPRRRPRRAAALNFAVKVQALRSYAFGFVRFRLSLGFAIATPSLQG